MAIDLVNKYYRFDATNVKNSLVGGRLYSAVYSTSALPNGVLGGLGDFVTDSDLVRNFVLPTEATAKTLIPYAIEKPEINYDETYKENNRLGIFSNPKGKPFPVTKLQENDVVTYSADYLKGKANADVAVGDVFVLDTDGLLVYADGTTIDATQYKTTFKVIKIENSHIPTYVAGDGSITPSAYKVYELSVAIA